MNTLHVFRSKPDDQVRELIREIDPGEIEQFALYEDGIDYDRLIDELFNHDRVIAWW